MTLHDRVRTRLRANRAAVRPPWTVTDLARMIGVPRGTLAAALTRGFGPGGVSRDGAPVVARIGGEPQPPAVTLAALAEALGCDVGELTGCEQRSPDNAPDNGSAAGHGDDG